MSRFEREYSAYVRSFGCIVYRAPRSAQARFHVRTPRDVFGIYDFVVLTPRDGVAFVQVTSDKGGTARRRKIERFLSTVKVATGSLLDLLDRTYLALRRTNAKRGEPKWRHQRLKRDAFLAGRFLWETVPVTPMEVALEDDEALPRRVR